MFVLLIAAAIHLSLTMSSITGSKATDNKRRSKPLQHFHVPQDIELWYLIGSSDPKMQDFIFPQ